MKISQESQILSYLKSGNSLTPIDALEKMKCFRLSGRILDLRKAGHDIRTEIIESNGKRFASYSLNQKNPEDFKEQTILL